MTFISKLKSLLGMGGGNNVATQRPQGHKPQAQNGKAGHQGQIKHLNYSKGYGFIVSKDFDKNVFVHFSDCIDRIKKGDTVSFNVVVEDRGPRAKEVRVVS